MPITSRSLPGSCRGRALARARRGLPEQDAEESRGHLGVETGQHVLERGELAEEPAVLEGPPDALGRHHVRSETVDALRAEADGAGGQRGMSGDRVEERGLAGAVRADDRAHLAGIDPQEDAGDRSEAAIAHGDVVELEEGHRYSR